MVVGVLVVGEGRVIISHGIQLKPGVSTHQIESLWNDSFVRLSCELEGHALGGGLLKLEPGEAARIILPAPAFLARLDVQIVNDAIATMRTWRHYTSDR